MSQLNMGDAMSLLGQVAVVTGGGTGIGLMIATGFAANGAKVYITGRREEVLKKAASSVKDVPGKLIPLVMDVTSQKSIDQGVEELTKLEGKVDVLVNNAGTVLPKDPDFYQQKTANMERGGDPFNYETFEVWTELFTLNSSAPFFVTKSFMPLLVKGAESRNATAVVINTSSISAEIQSVVPTISFCYGMTKSALDKLTLCLAADFAKRKIPIRVNAIHPGLFPNEAVSADFMPEDGILPGYVAAIPMGPRSLGSVRDMAMTTTYLATSEYTNGVILKVDGGLTLVNP